MLNWFAKVLLVATSLSPILGAVAVNQIALQKPWICWVPWLSSAILLTVICWLLLWYASENAQRESIHIAEFESSDKEVLAFLLAYLLPFVSSKNMAFEGEWLTGAYILLIIFLVVAHAGVFHFNPVMGLLGYHFYGIKSKEGVSQVLICRRVLTRPKEDVTAVKLAPHLYLAAGKQSA